MLQYAVLFALRAIKYDTSIDDSQYIHQLTYNQLFDAPFRQITDDEYASLQLIKSALASVIAHRAIPKQKMLAALDKEQYLEYVHSYDWDISHVESDMYSKEQMPSILFDYAQYLKEGDKYTRLSNLFRRTRKRDGYGKTARERFYDKAFGCYEEAIMLITNAIETNPLRNPMPDVQLSAEIQRWLDREVNPEPGFEPDVSITGVPRIRGIKSKYLQVTIAPATGQRLRQYWRQREALTRAALNLLYSAEHIDSDLQQGLEITGEMLQERLAHLKSQHK